MVKFSVKKPYTVFVGVVICLILGLVSFLKMQTDLMPNMSLPYVMVITTYPGASPDRIEATVTEPLESGLGTVNGVENVTSVSNENYSMITLEFQEDMDMNSAMVKLSSALDLVPLPDGAGTPMLMEISMDMMPVIYASVSYEGKDIYELTEFVDETVVPEIERSGGVASVDISGAIEKSVEIRLNTERIDDLNTELAAYVNDELDDAKKELDDAKKELSSAKNELKGSQSDLTSAQDQTTSELATTSKMLDQAVATQSAYNAQVSTLEASKTALEMEKKAYEDAGLQEKYDQVNTMFAQSQGMAAAMGADPTTLPADIQDAIANPDKLENLKKMMTAAGMGDQVSELTVESLAQMDSILNTRIGQIDTELANLETEITAAKAVVEQVNAQVAEATANYEALEQGKMAAAIQFGSATAQMANGLTAIEDGEKQLEEAEESFKTARDEALKNANLDMLLSLDTLSGLIYAQNFAMPAGYIYEGDDQILLKVGDEFDNVKDLENAMLCNIDGLGDVRLCDVADVTWIDNQGDQYAKVNGAQGIVLTVSRASTAGTSVVSDNVNAKTKALMEEYEGLNITNLMDQGDYIDLIVRSVLQNLIVGAILAIIVLALFLRSVKPTLVVAFSIPLSVLVAVVLMYFSGISLNIISLSGLALGIGMLVDNAIVVIENIYRLRGLGIPAPKAAILGAKQVAGAIIASTLTTICVFFPIVFTTGLVKQIFVDMALTIGYSLVASLLIALTVVPAMSATFLKNSQPKPQKLLDRVLGVYEKVLRFCLKRKIVPVAMAIVLLILCGAVALSRGVIILPNMAGDDMAATMVVDEEKTDEEGYAIADQAMEAIQALEGVEYVGIMSGSDNASGMSMNLLSSGGGTHDFNIMILLEEDTSNHEKAKEIEAIMEGLDLKKYTVSESTLDFGALMSSGLTVNIFGNDNEELLKVSRDVMDIVATVEGFEEISNGQEEQKETYKLVIDKDEAMRYGLTVAQIFQELNSNLTTEKNATVITIDDEEYDVLVVNEDKAVDTSNIMDYEFEYKTKDDDGKEVTEMHKLSEFATKGEAESMAEINRENQNTYVAVTAVTQDGYNTSLLSKQVEEKLASYDAPDGVEIQIAGEMEEIASMLKNIMLMMILAIIFIYLIMVAQFQSFMSPFIIIFTIPLAFTGGLIGLFITRQEISMVALMGFIMLAGIIVNNGIVFVDYVNNLRLEGMEKREALVETGRTRMRPILMTTLTTVLAMATLAFDTSDTAAMSKAMAVVVIFGLLYATLMTLFIVPVLYDFFFRRELKKIDVGTDNMTEESVLEAIKNATAETTDGI